MMLDLMLSVVDIRNPVRFWARGGDSQADWSTATRSITWLSYNAGAVASESPGHDDAMRLLESGRYNLETVS
jgi:hypothetical protein